MSSTSRSSGEKKPEGDGASAAEPPSKRPSPGRYSLSTEGSTEMAAVRIDSTRMAAVRPEPLPGTSDVTPAPASAAAAASEAPPRRGTLPRGIEAVTVASTPSRPAPAALNSIPSPTLDADWGSSPPGSAPPHSQAPISAKPSSSKAPPSKGTGAAALANSRPLSSPPPPLRSRTPAPSSKASWLPPPPPPKRESQRPPGASQFPGFDEGSIAFAFDALMSEGTEGMAGTATVDLAPVRELFAELAANHMRHVRDFMIDVKWGEAPREWIEICIPAVSSLRRAAERLELGELAPALEVFGKNLEATVGQGSEGARTRTIEGETKERLLAEYDKLVVILPQAFALERDTSRREAVIIQSLCLSVPDVRKVTIDKLHAAGLTSLKTLFDAKADEVSQVAGIPEALALKIVERFQAYRRELQNASPQDARAAEREKLGALTAQLKEQHDGYEEASRGWSPESKAKKRDLIRAREETWLAISLLLARFGEVERLQGIEKVPFAQRITQLTDYLDEARDRYRADS